MTNLYNLTFPSIDHQFSLLSYIFSSEDLDMLMSISIRSIQETSYSKKLCSLIKLFTYAQLSKTILIKIGKAIWTYERADKTTSTKESIHTDDHLKKSAIIYNAIASLSSVPY